MLVWACIAPHGGELIPDLAAGDLARMARTRGAMRELADRCAAADPETLVVLTPHGFCIEGSVSVSIADVGRGRLDAPDGGAVEMQMGIDVELATAIAEDIADLRIPSTEIGYDHDGKRLKVFPVDWGALIPLYFLLRDGSFQRVVVMCPDRSLSRAALVACGRAIVGAATRFGRRIAVVCSADQGHGHDPEGPYGFSRMCAAADAAYCRAVADNALGRLLRWRNDRIEASLTDSYWQTLMLHGALSDSALTPSVLSYEAPTYFGMLCASYDHPQPSGGDSWNHPSVSSSPST